MNDKKIAFIYCVNNRALYEESVRYVKSLHVPEGYEIEFIAIESASSIASGYNQGMRQTDAKYKVYLHQDVFIVNKNFLYDIIALFEKYPKLGMIGVAGAKTVPKNGVWWESTQRFGKVYDSHTGEMKLLSFKDTELDYEPVQAIDGLIMITQYDTPWREDLFTGWHFYDLSQCQEFLLAGYDVGVVRQNEPWCVHDCGIVNVKNGFDDYRKKFIDVYGENVQRLNKKFLPLVSILIRAYNQTAYLKEALESAINQTYPNIEIIIGDDSTNDKVKDFIKPYLDKHENITYFKNKKEKPDYGYQNLVNCFKRSKGEYINFLNHDDILHNEKIERMMNYFLKNPNLTLVTSVRQLIDEAGNKLPLTGAYSKIFEKDTLLDGYELSRIVINNFLNIIGEPTAVLFKRKYIDENKINYFNGVRFIGIGDVASWFSLLQHGDGVYISDPLSYIRIHPNQNQNKPVVHVHGIIAWFNLIKHSYEKGIIQNTIEYKKMVNKWLNIFIPILTKFLSNEDYVDNKLKEELSNCYKEAIDEVIGKKNVRKI
jgi:GT2 family glycosyltransferase